MIGLCATFTLFTEHNASTYNTTKMQPMEHPLQIKPSGVTQHYSNKNTDMSEKKTFYSMVIYGVK